MSYKFSMSQCRFAFLLMCSMLLGLRGAVAQSGPEFLQQRWNIFPTVRTPMILWPIFMKPLKPIPRRRNA